MKALGCALAAFLLYPVPATAQSGIACQRLSERLPVRPNPAVQTYSGALGSQVLNTIAALRRGGLPAPSGEKVVVLLGEQWVWVIILREGGFGCPLPPIRRSEYEAARRPVLGTSG